MRLDINNKAFYNNSNIKYDHTEKAFYNFFG